MESHKQDEQPAKNILVVDDDEGIREVLQMAFATEGYVVTTAANGQEALDILSRSSHFGLILLDLMMPTMNGREFIEAFNDNHYPPIPIILMTAYADRVKGLETVKDVIAKPMNFDTLIARVEANFKT